MSLIDRRTVLKTGTAAAALVAAPAYLRAQAGAVKVGILQPVTGALAQDGEYGTLGASIAINEINASGGIKSTGRRQARDGVRRRPLQPRRRHRRGRAHAGRRRGRRSSAASQVPICLAATQAASRYDLPYIVDVGVSDQIVKRGLKNTFRFGPGFGIVTTPPLDNLAKLNDAAGKPAKTVVLVHEDGLFGSRHREADARRAAEARLRDPRHDRPPDAGARHVQHRAAHPAR